MVTPLKFYKHDPNGLGRGPGAYYHRGHGYFSFYEQDHPNDPNRRSRDYARKSSGIVLHSNMSKVDVDLTRLGYVMDKSGNRSNRTRFLHIGDGKLHRK